MTKGQTRDDRELFQFTIEPFVTAGFLLKIRFSGDIRESITVAGIWPYIEKAAQDTATKLLNGAVSA